MIEKYNFVNLKIWQRIRILHTRLRLIKVYEKPLVFKNTHFLVKNTQFKFWKSNDRFGFSIPDYIWSNFMETR
jgi:hypothetical protein